MSSAGGLFRESLVLPPSATNFRHPDESRGP